MKRFDGVLIKEDKIIFYAVVAELPVERNGEVEIIGLPKVRRQMRWKNSVFLSEEQQKTELYEKKMGIA